MSEDTLQTNSTLYVQNKTDNTFSVDKFDKIFALLYFLVGYAYVRIQTDLRWRFSYGGAFITLFVALYVACVLIYMHKKGKQLNSTGAFWLCILLALGLAYAIFDNTQLEGWQGIALHLTAVYFTLSACGASILQRTSCFLPFDILNALIIVPFSNFFSQVHAIYRMLKKGNIDKKHVAGTLLGIVLLIAVFAAVIPMLMQADSNFNDMLKDFNIFEALFNSNELFYIVASLPVGAYLYGLVFGSINKRHINVFHSDMLEKTYTVRHIVPQNTIYIVLGGVAALYILFIVVQSRSIFSVFEGRLFGTEIYSEYAREGFFSLCRVSVINAALIFASDLFAKLPRIKSSTLRVFNIVISMLTLVLLASAFAKMLLYIGTYGLTQKRILTIWLMTVLAVMFICVIVWQFKNIDIIRITACTAAVLFCILALCNIDAITNNFNEKYAVAETSRTEVCID